MTHASMEESLQCFLKVYLHTDSQSEFESCHINEFAIFRSEFAIFRSQFAIFREMIDVSGCSLHLEAFPTHGCLVGV